MSLYRILSFTFFLIIYSKIKGRNIEGVNAISRSKGVDPRHKPYPNGIVCGTHYYGTDHCPAGRACGYLNDHEGWVCSPFEDGIFCLDTKDFCPKGYYCSISNSTICIPNVTDEYGKEGVNLHQYITIDQFECLKEELSIQFIILSAGRSYNYNTSEIIKNARKAGIDDVDISIPLCVLSSRYTEGNCGNSKSNIINELNILENNNVTFGRVWLDITGYVGIRWYQKVKKNIKLIDEIIDTLKENNQSYGIYTNEYDWKQITGNIQKYNNIQLWYSNHDNKNNFNDYYNGGSFGGFRYPTIKQYDTQDSNVCKLSVGYNWKP